MSDQKSANRVQIIIAVIGLAGVISTGLFGYLSNRPVEPTPVDPNGGKAAGLVTPTNNEDPVDDISTDDNGQGQTDIQSDSDNGQTDDPGGNTDEDPGQRSIADEPEEEVVTIEPIVEFDVARFGGGSLKIGHHTQGGTLIVSDLTFHWDYDECPQLGPQVLGSVMVEYKFEVEVTKERDSELLSPDEYKLMPDDLDAFAIDVKYPGKGIYKMWVEFNYRTFGSDQKEHYITHESFVERCAE